MRRRTQRAVRGTDAQSGTRLLLASLTLMTSSACSDEASSSLARFGTVALATRGWVAPQEIEGFDRASAWEVFESPTEALWGNTEAAHDGALVVLYLGVRAEDEARILRNVESGGLDPRMGGLMLGAALAQKPNFAIGSGVVMELLNGTELEVATALSALPVLTGRLLDESLAAGVFLYGSGEPPLTHAQAVFGRGHELLVQEWKEWLGQNSRRTVSALLHQTFRDWCTESGPPATTLRQRALRSALSFPLDSIPKGVSIGKPEWTAAVEALLERDPGAPIDFHGILTAHNWKR